MQIVTALALLVIAGASAAATPGPHLTGTFDGTGRACSGALHIRAKTVEWNSSFSVCKPSRYEVLDSALGGEHGRIALRLKTRSPKCRYEVVEAEQVSAYSWDVRGYQSLESYQKRALPDWSNSPIPERMILSCPMVRSN